MKTLIMKIEQNYFDEISKNLLKILKNEKHLKKYDIEEAMEIIVWMGIVSKTNLMIIMSILIVIGNIVLLIWSASNNI